MHLANTLLAIFIAACAVRSIYQILRSTLPALRDVATIFAAFYCLPTALVDLLEQLNPLFAPISEAAKRPDLQLQSLILTASSLSSMYSGEWLYFALLRRSHSWRMPLHTRVGRDSMRIVALTCVSISSWIAGIWIFGILEFSSGYNVASTSSIADAGQASAYFGILAAGIALGHITYSWHTNGRPSHWVSSALLGGLLLLTVLVRPKRLEIVGALVIPGLLLFATNKVARRFAPRLLAAIIALGVLSSTACLRIGQEIDLQSITFHLLSEGFFAGHATPGILEGLETGDIGFEDFERVQLGVLASLPGVIFKNKALSVYALNDNIAGAAPLGASSIAAETYLQGGLATHLVIWLSIGALFGFASIRQVSIHLDLQHGVLTFRRMLYFTLVSIFLIHLRDGIIPAMKLSIQGMLLWVGITMLPSPRINAPASRPSN